jgi:DNA-binding beta-propeller fold protein YncE
MRYRTRPAMGSTRRDASLWVVAFASLSQGCSPQNAQPLGVPSSPTITPSLAPGQRLTHASLLGTDVIGLPTGVTLTPDAAPGSLLLELDPHVPRAPTFRAGGAVSSALSPDGRTLLVLTSGYNRTVDEEGERVTAASSEWVFVFDVVAGSPRQIQAVPVANTFGGLAFAPAGDRFYVAGGSDDVVREYARAPDGSFAEVLPAVLLGHHDPSVQSDDAGLGGLGIDESSYAAGLAVTHSGSRLVVANDENDSVSVLDLRLRKVSSEIPLRPGGGVAGGEFPYWVVTAGESRAYVSCQRDREVDEIDLDAARVIRRIKVGGQPAKMTMNRAETRLFVANTNSDTVSVIELPSGAVLSELRTSAPPRVLASVAPLLGANPNDVALSPDEHTLYVTNGGTSTLAVFALSSVDRGGKGEAGSGISVLTGLIPTGFYPHAVSVASSGAFLYVTHGKSPTGPNPRGPWSNVEASTDKPYKLNGANQYSLQLTRGGLLAFPVPSGGTLATLTRQALLNNRFDTVSRAEPPVFRALHGAVKHVIYVIGENRTYDQILGDLPGSDGDPRLVHWGEPITPNHHALAREFVAADRFFDAGGVSGDGWEWSTSGRTTDAAEKAIPVAYADRGKHSYDWEGMNRNVNVALPDPLERGSANPRTPPFPDLLPGSADVGGVDEPDVGGRGFLWDAAMGAGLLVRNYGFFIDDSRYGFPASDPAGIPPIARPFEAGVRVAYATRPSLLPITDPYFRGFDMNVADYWRVEEWAREFDGYEAKGELPALELVRLPHDHLGRFLAALDGVNTPDTQVADNDYALGKLVERVSKSPFWEDTVIVALEDDAQNGADHVDAHRSVVLVAGGHVRRHAKVETVYSTPSVLRTIELLLGLPPLGQADAFAPPMEDFLALEPDDTPFVASVPAVLRSSKLPLPPAKPGEITALPRGDAALWGMLTEGFDFSRADAAPAERVNRILYCELVSATGCTSDGAEALTCSASIGSPDED